MFFGAHCRIVCCDGLQVLDFRKLDANLFLMSRKPVHVATLVAGICRHCRPLLLPTVGLQFRVQPPDARVQLDPRRLHQILINGLRCANVWCGTVWCSVCALWCCVGQCGAVWGSVGWCGAVGASWALNLALMCRGGQTQLSRGGGGPQNSLS
jgi:hypothetical protein